MGGSSPTLTLSPRSAPKRAVTRLLSPYLQIVGCRVFAVGREPPLRVVAEVQSARRRSVSLGVAKHLREKLR
jgi:hypothetical protein